jgi:hypothetical protein
MKFIDVLKTKKTKKEQAKKRQEQIAKQLAKERAYNNSLAMRVTRHFTSDDKHGVLVPASELNGKLGLEIGNPKPDDCTFAKWGSWAPCSPDGSTHRERRIDKTGTVCTGSTLEEIRCNHTAVDPAWQAIATDFTANAKSWSCLKEILLHFAKK